jgi:hypothetical protein
MSEQERDYRPQIPTWAAVGAMVVAVSAVLALVFVLYQRTTGPGEVVLEFYEDAASGDCTAATALLAPSADEAALATAEDYCESGAVPDTRRVESVTLDGPEGDADRSDVVIDADGEAVTWHLEREGDDWFISEVPDS